MEKAKQIAEKLGKPDSKALEDICISGKRGTM